MAPHHRSAIEMAQIARQRAGHPQIRALAASIIASQGAEIDQLLQIHTALVGNRGQVPGEVQRHRVRHGPSVHLPVSTCQG